jgi:hypothetical protein
MERRFALCEELDRKELALKIDLLKGYFQEKKIAIVIKTGNLTFQTEVATVLVNNAKFTQAKGKTRTEAEERAVKKAWEKTLSRAKDSDFAWLQRHLQSNPDKTATRPGPKLRPTPGLTLSLSQSSPHRHQPTSEPVSPVDPREQRLSRSSHSRRYTREKLDDLILKAAETVKTSASPAPRRRLSSRSRGIPSFSSEGTIGSSCKEKVSPRRSLVMPEQGDSGSLQSVLEEADMMKQIRRLEYRSLKEARFQMKMKRGNLSLAGAKVC